MVRVALDFSPGVAQPAGIGRYARELARALSAQLGADLILWYGSPRQLHATPPPAATRRPIPLSPTTLTRLWHRLQIPLPLELFTGRVDIVHGLDFLVPPARAPRVATIHDLSFLLVPELGHPRLVRFLRAAVPRTLRLARHIIAVSEAVRADLIRLYRVDPDRVHTIYHGVSTTMQPVEPARRQPLLASLGVRDPYVIAVGTIEPRKGYPILLRAVESLAHEIGDLQLVIVGSPGWLSRPIEADIIAAERRGRVVWLRWVDDATLAALYSGARAFVTASYYEGFNLPLLEALACATPAVATDLTVHHEVAGEAALYVPVAAPERLADALRALLTDETLNARLRAAASVRASRFSWARSATQHLEVYQLTLRERAAQS